MFKALLKRHTRETVKPREGELYKEVTVGGKVFELRYGYYEEFERNGRFNDPIPIYPDFIEYPVYTDEGHPIVTAMQDVCANYECAHDDDGDSCQDCKYFKKHEDLFGICQSPDRLKDE